MNSADIRKGIVLVISLLICVSLFLCSCEKEKNDSEQRSKEVDSELSAIDLRNNLDKDSTYPDYYYAISLKSNGAGAEKEAGDSIIQNEAIRWYAEKKGISVQSSDVDSVIAELISTQEEAGENDSLNKACKDKGIDFKDLVDQSRIIYARQSYYNKVYDEFIKAEGIENDADSDEVQKKWNAYIADIVEDFKGTDYYSTLVTAIENDSDMWEKYGTDLTKIKDNDIPVDGYCISL